MSAVLRTIGLAVFVAVAYGAGRAEPATSARAAAGCSEGSRQRRRAQTAQSGSYRQVAASRCSVTGSSKPPASRW